MKFNELQRIIHDKVHPFVTFLIMVKFHFTTNIFFYIISIFFRFISILILCSSLSMSKSEFNKSSFSTYLRYLTSQKLLELIKISNTGYIILSFCIFILFCIRMSIYYYLIKKIKSKAKLENRKIIIYYQTFMEHLVFLLYPFILEFLFQILYSYIFPDTFIFKKDLSSALNIIITILNLILIIGYNICNYFFFLVINRPFSDKDVAIKYEYSSKKFWMIFLLQNVCLIQNIQKYFKNDNQFQIFGYIYICILILIFIILFLISLKKYNYSNIPNTFISILASFCFFSLLIEVLCKLTRFKFETVSNIVCNEILKLIIAIYFIFLNNNINNNFLFKLSMKELFIINKRNIKSKVYDIFLYIFENLKKVKYNKKDISTTNLINYIYEHQNKCSLSNCKCKLIQIIPHGKQYEKNFNLNLIERISFLIESAFVNIDFCQNFNLNMILSEHFFNFRENPIMAYSFNQTVIIFNSNKLSIPEYLKIYEACQKYIEAILNNNYGVKRMLVNKNVDEINKIQEKELKLIEKMSQENLKKNFFTNLFIIYEKIDKIQKMMNDYCQIIIEIIKKRNNVEESTKLNKYEDTGEILSIDFAYLTSDKIEEIINMMRKETELYKYIEREISYLKTSKFPIEFYYKIFLFWDMFMQGKLDEKLIPIFYSFTNDHNLFSTSINPNIFLLLRQRYLDLNNKGLNLYYCIFKYSRGMIISYFSEPLAHKLGYIQSDLIGNDIDILIPDEISKSHNNLILHYILSKQSRVYKNINNKLFNKKGLLINSKMNGASLLGLSSNLLVMINVKLVEVEKEYILFYNQSLDLISLSENFYEDFLLDLDLISKSNLNLLGLFGINHDLMKKKIMEMKNNIFDYKNYLEIMMNEVYSKKLYKQGNKYNYIKYKLFDEIENHNFEESENFNMANTNNKLLRAQKYIENIYNDKFDEKINNIKLMFKKPKSIVLNNFNKYVNNNDKIDLNDKSYKALLESFYLFQSNNTISNIIYTIFINIHIIYDVPFITIKIKEDIDLNKAYELEKPLIEGKINIKEKRVNLITNKGDRIDTLSQMAKGQTDDTVTSMGLNVNLKMANFQKNNKNKIHFFERYIKELVVIFICGVLIVYVFILTYQLGVIQNIYNIFLAFFYNYVQRDKLVNLHSSMCSGYYYYTGLFNYSHYVDFENYQVYIRNMSEEYSGAYHTFYQNYIKYRFALGKNLEPLYTNFTYDKIIVSWNETHIINNYINEVEVMIYQSTLSSLSDTINGILIDAELFFKANYKNSPLQKLNSNYGQTLYYLCANLEKNFMTFFDMIQNEINDVQYNYSNSSKILATLIETLGYILNLATLIMCIYFLKKSNGILYKNIINLFVDFTQEGNYTFKNNYENFILVEKLNRLKNVLNNFSIKAIDQLNKNISHTTFANKEFNENNDYNILSNRSKLSNSQKKVSSKEVTDKRKIRKNSEMKLKQIIDKNISSKSITNSRSQNKLLNPVSSVNLISKLNQNIQNEKSNNINISTKNSLNQDSSIQNINTNNLNNSNNNEENTLTTEKIFEKLKIVDINTINIFVIFCSALIVALLIYFIIKIIVTYNYFSKSKDLFVDYSIVTFEYSMIKNYFNNLNIIMVNRYLGKEDLLAEMQSKVEEQFKKSEEVKKKSMKNYPKINRIFTDLNSRNNSDLIKDILCKDQKLCDVVFDTEYNIVKKGIDIGLKTVAQEIYNFYKDFTVLREEIKELNDIKKYFINDDYIQVDLSLNFLLSEVEDECAEAFLEEADDLITSFKNVIIYLNIFIIIILTLISISLITLVIMRTTELLSTIEKSSIRISYSINGLKEKNNFGIKKKKTGASSP